MKFGVIVPVFRELGQADIIKRLVIAAEEMGYDSVWFADHIVIPEYAVPVYGPTFFEPLTTMIFGAGMTKRIKFGWDVMVTPYRPPVLVAKMISTLDVLSGGRVILGAGVGILKGEFEVLGVPYKERGAITDEYLAAMIEIWTHDKPSFKGKYVSFEGISSLPRPVQKPHPPIWIGGNTARAIRRAVEVGDGWHPLRKSVEEYEQGVQQIRAKRLERGDSGPFTFSYSCPEMRMLEEPWQPHLSPAPRRTTNANPSIAADYKSLPYSMLTASNGRPMFTGNAEEVAKDIKQFQGKGMGYMVARFPQGISEREYIKNMELFATRVAPLVEKGPDR